MSGLRVIAGTAKGKRLKSRKAKDLRPATGFVREALFNILGPRVVDCVFLDLFAGTGSVGIEALSRGAAKVVFVEADAQNASLIKENLKITGFGEKGVVYQADVLKILPVLKKQGWQFDLVFIDPPFKRQLAGPVLEALFQLGLLAPAGIAVTRTASREESNFKFRPFREERYGSSVLRFFAREND
ncbi:MAG: rRNA methyltransferase RsmD [Thermacetogenium phaeum]|jgi:16S rRNA (guanine(966)-N(2))-methyltransferase RsmD|uniref:rRNA methyltransferase RsmD n=1 Tax=Thermacetogenium phaeum TaxID=85874 RepID=A0A124FK02_9THEO|nr:MAG: rRNA methyltransferase RsmD [Thermacetogenium phaeum]